MPHILLHLNELQRIRNLLHDLSQLPLETGFLAEISEVQEMIDNARRAATAFQKR